MLTLVLVVSCDKQDDFVSPEVLAVEAIEAGVESPINSISQDEVDDIISSLLENLSSYGKSKRGEANNAGRGADFVAVHIFSQTVGSVNTRFLMLLDESNDDVCTPESAGAVASVYFDNANSDGSLLNVEDADGVVSTGLRGSFAGFFAGANNVVVELNSNNKAVNRGEFSDANAATVGEFSFDFGCSTTIDSSSFYTIAPAPFPLTGFLATIIDQSMFAGTSLNYAATTTSTLIQAIEADINDGN